MAAITTTAARTPSPQAFVPRQSGLTGASGAEPSTAEAINSTPYGFTQTQANALLRTVIEMRRVLVAHGLMS